MSSSNNFLGKNNIFNANRKGRFISSVDKKYLIVFVAIMIIIFVFVGFMIYIYFQNYSANKIQDFVEVELLSNMHSCDNNVLELKNIPNSTMGNDYSLNFWIYVSDLKHFSKNLNGLGNVMFRGNYESNNYDKLSYQKANPGIYMDNNTNSLTFAFDTEEELEENNFSPGTSDGMDGENHITLKNLPLQRWTCINVSVSNHYVDIYVDGKLKTSKKLNYPPANKSGTPLILGPHGGFDGYLSRIKYSNRTLNPTQIYNRYKEGPRITPSLVDMIKDTFSKSD